MILLKINLSISLICLKTSCGSPFTQSKRQNSYHGIGASADLERTTSLPSSPVLYCSSHGGLPAILHAGPLQWLFSLSENLPSVGIHMANSITSIMSYSHAAFSTTSHGTLTTPLSSPHSPSCSYSGLLFLVFPKRLSSFTI